jgi:hypothetical protein
MTEDETPLAGSRLNRVVRIGDTVHRPAGPWTPAVHALLAHLQARGYTLGPRPLGYDRDGREIVSYIPGLTVGSSLPWPGWIWDESLLAEIGQAAARYHLAVRDFRPEGVLIWRWDPAGLRPNEIVCHHDLAPYNVVVRKGRLAGIIDWDLAGPGTIRSELAFLAWQWVPLQHPDVARFFGWSTSPDLARRLRLVLDSYGLADRTGFVDDIVARIRLNRDIMLRKAGEGDPAYIRLAEQGHVTGMDRAIEFVATIGDDLQARIG